MFALRRCLRTLPALALVVFQVILAPAASAAPGDLDPTFGIGGEVTTDFALNGESDDYAQAVALQPDGKIVVVGTSYFALPTPPGGGGSSFVIARYAPNGSLDPSFGTGGKVETQVGARSGAQAVALQPDGRIVAAGWTVDGASDTNMKFALARYDADGSLDTSFGTGGTVTTDFSGGYDAASAIVLQADGRVIVSGPGSKFDLARFNTDGSLDTTFGTGGKVAVDFPSVSTGGGYGYAAAIQPDGRIVVAGTASFSVSGMEFALIRFNTDGSFDTSFGLGGGIHTDFTGGEEEAMAVALGLSGEIVAAGLTGHGPGTVDLALAAYNTDGTPESTFGAQGKVTTDFAGGNDQVNSVAVGPDGRITAAAFAATREFALIRYNTDGSLDGSFGTGGKVSTGFPGAAEAKALVLQPDGRILVIGCDSGAVDEDFALARYQGAPPVDLTPTIATFAPRSGPVGTAVTITGSNLVGANTVVFDGVVQPSFSVDATGTYLTTTVPAGATSGPIWVSTPYGSASSVDSFIVTTGYYDRHLSMHLSGHLVAYGHVTMASGPAAGYQDVVVKIQRRGPWRWRTVTSGSTDQAGWYSIHVGDRPGKYRAKITEMTLGNGEVCGDAISFARWHHHD